MTSVATMSTAAVVPYTDQQPIASSTPPAHRKQNNKESGRGEEQEPDPLRRLGEQRDVTRTWPNDAIGRFMALRSGDPQEAFHWFVRTVREYKEQQKGEVFPQACLFVDGVDPCYHIYPYQAFALRFALYRETHAYHDICGGIMNMFPGLGKTLWLLTLIWTTWRSERINKRPTLVVVPTSVVYEWRANVFKFFGDRLPFFVMDRNWSTSARAVDNVTVTELSRYPLVITTYPVLRSVFSRQGFADECVLRSDDNKVMGLRQSTSSATSTVKGPSCLYRVPWARVAFDESQTACNIARVTFQSCYAVPAPFRWCLTGMPLRNNTVDLFGQLLISGLHTAERASIARPGTFHAVHKGLWKPNTFRDARLHTTMLTVVYKDTHLRMPPLRTLLHPVCMHHEERRLYEVFADMARKEFRRFEEGTVSLINVLTRVTRMRQASNCAYLLHLSDEKKRRERGNESAATNTASASVIHNPIINTPSSSSPPPPPPLHTFQASSPIPPALSPPPSSAAAAAAAQQESDQLTFDEILVENDDGDGKEAVEVEMGDNVLDPVRLGLGESMLQWCRSYEGTAGRDASKVRAILSLVRRIVAGKEERDDNGGNTGYENDDAVEQGEGVAERKPIKVIVYSAFAEMLRVLSRALGQEQQQPHCIMTGQNSAEERTATLDQFRLSRTHNVLFMTYKVGSLGLTLTEATHVIFTEPWFCYSVMLQSLYRVYRIGQRRPVHVHWMISHVDDIDDASDAGMIEWRILEIASAKIRMTNELLAQDLVADVPQHILSYMDETEYQANSPTGGTKRKKTTSTEGPPKTTSRSDTVTALRSFLFASRGNSARARLQRAAKRSRTGVLIPSETE